ncbi:MAG: hypothetical protein GY749_46620, partial [Desulfobacteraceae bacterium]|nr:hypothetical protein [Desulfobacteraceae bacterium]
MLILNSKEPILAILTDRTSKKVGLYYKEPTAKQEKDFFQDTAKTSSKPNSL